MGCLFPIALALTFFASLAGWWINLAALTVSSLLMFGAARYAMIDEEENPTRTQGCIVYLFLNAGWMLLVAFTSDSWNWKALLDAVVLAAVLLLAIAKKPPRQKP